MPTQRLLACSLPSQPGGPVPTLGSEREMMSLHNILREEIKRAIAEGGGAVNFSYITQDLSRPW